jgi:lethal(2) giant larvae protein
LTLIGENDAYVWKGHNPLVVKEGSVQYAGGFQPTCVVQVHPPMMITALAVDDNWKL